MQREIFMDLFDEEVQAVGKAAIVVGVVAYLAKQAAWYTLSSRNEVQYAIEAHLPQGYDRSIVAARSDQILTKKLMSTALDIDAVKGRLRLAADRDSKMTGMSELFKLSLAGILSAAHMHSLTITLHAVKNMTLVLVHVLRKLEEGRGFRGGAMASKLRSWWSGGTRNLMMQIVLEKLQKHMEVSPFSMVFDGGMITADVDQGFYVKDLLQSSTPRVVQAAKNVVRDVLGRRAAHAFSMTGVVTGEELRGLLLELCVKLESSVAWSDWLTIASVNGAGTERSGTTRSSRSSSISSNGGVMAAASAMGGENGALETPTGPAEVLTGGICGSSELQRDSHGAQWTPPLPHNGMCAEREEELRNEEMVLKRAAGFFHEIIHSASFNEICIAYATELLECSTATVGDLRCLRSYEVSTDSVKLPHLIVALENERMLLFDHDFDVRPYLQLLCEETVRATCHCF